MMYGVVTGAYTVHRSLPKGITMSAALADTDTDTTDTADTADTRHWPRGVRFLQCQLSWVGPRPLVAG